MRARDLWVRIESIHAVTYFAPESAAAATDAGLKGFWMGYFGFRAAPMGPVSAGVVEASFANFAPAMVARSIPDAWSYAQPEALVAARARAAATALRAASPDAEAMATSLNPVLRRVVQQGVGLGRPLFAANAALAPLADPVEQLWQLCTTLREHRGDGHVAALAAAGIDGCQAHQLLIADQGLPPEVFFDNRGWDEAHQAEALAGLEARGFIEGSDLTERGRALRRSVETVTDARASAPYEAALAATEHRDLVGRLTPLARAVQVGGIIPFPNPMGLPQL